MHFTEDMFEQAIIELFEKMGYRKISMKTYPGMRHEILNEKDKETVWNDILDFIVSRHASYLCP